MLQDDITLPAGSARPADLDPFTDSIEVEYGGYDFTDNRPHPLINTQPRPLHQMQQIAEEPVGVVDTGGIGLIGFEGYEVNPAHQDSHVPGTNQMQEPVGGWETGNTGLTGFDNGYETGGANLCYLDDPVPESSDYTGGYVPPPPYQSAVDGSDGGMTSGRGQGTAQQTPSGGDKGGYWLRQRH